MSSFSSVAISQSTIGRVLVTGATGFLGRAVCNQLRSRHIDVVGVGNYHGPSPQVGWDERGIDLTSPFAFRGYLDHFGPFECVLHLAGWNGGILFNRCFPAEIFRANTMMALNVLEGCRRAGVEKVLSAVASCAYGDPDLDPPGATHRDAAVPVWEEKFPQGRPHPSVACHGHAKRNLQLASQFYRQQYGMVAVTVCPTTLYGPGDSFDADRTKVMGAMVKRFVDAADSGAPEVACHGDGAPLREFLYVEDAAALIVKALALYDDSALPLNLGSGQEVSVKELAGLVAAAAGYGGRIGWTGEDSGQSRKRLCMARQRDILGEFHFTPLAEGVARTVDYYRGLRAQAQLSGA